MRYVIIGNGAAGNAAAEAIRHRDEKGEVIILSDEPHPAYYRPLITYLIHNGPGSQAIFRDPLHTPKDVIVKLGKRVVAISPQEKTVTLADGERLSYDKLLLAVGASPFFPPIPGLKGEGVWGLRGIDEARAIAQAARRAKKAVVIRGGRIGSTVALALRRLGLEVSVVERRDRLVPMQLDKVASQIFCQILEQEGVKLYLGREVKEVERRRGLMSVFLGKKTMGVLLDDGRRLEAELIVVAWGVVPNLDLPRQAGCAVGRGVKVDKYLMTSVPDIYAAGDVVETVDLVTGESMVSGTWTNAVTMGQCAGTNMAGGKQEYPGALNIYNAMELAGHPVISVGIVFPRDGDEVASQRWGNNYKKLVFRGDRLVGALLVGEAIAGAGVYTALIREGKELGALKARLMEPGFGYAHFLHLPIPQTEHYL